MEWAVAHDFLCGRPLCQTYAQTSQNNSQFQEQLSQTIYNSLNTTQLNMSNEVKFQDLSLEFNNLKSRIKEVEKKNESILTKLNYYNKNSIPNSKTEDSYSEQVQHRHQSASPFARMSNKDLLTKAYLQDPPNVHKIQMLHKSHQNTHKKAEVYNSQLIKSNKSSKAHLNQSLDSHDAGRRPAQAPFISADPSKDHQLLNIMNQNISLINENELLKQ